MAESSIVVSASLRGGDSLTTVESGDEAVSANFATTGLFAFFTAGELESKADSGAGVVAKAAVAAEDVSGNVGASPSATAEERRRLTSVASPGEPAEESLFFERGLSIVAVTVPSPGEPAEESLLFERGSAVSGVPVVPDLDSFTASLFFELGCEVSNLLERGSAASDLLVAKAAPSKIASVHMRATARSSDPTLTDPLVRVGSGRIALVPADLPNLGGAGVADHKRRAWFSLLAKAKSACTEVVLIALLPGIIGRGVDGMDWSG